MMTAEQIPFDIPIREAFEAEDYLVTGSNKAAVDWVDRWPDWAMTHCSILYGTRGCGKTHLSHVWQYKTSAIRLTTDLIEVGNLSTTPHCVIIEDVEKYIDTPEAQESLFHLYNWQKENNGFLLLTSLEHPKHWPLTLPDLKSRMLASMAIEISAPDDDLLAAVIVKQFSDRQLVVPKEVMAYLLLRMERSFEAARHMVMKIDQLSLSQKRKITVPLVRDLLE